MILTPCPYDPIIISIRYGKAEVECTGTNRRHGKSPLYYACLYGQ